MKKLFTLFAVLAQCMLSGLNAQTVSMLNVQSAVDSTSFARTLSFSLDFQTDPMATVDFSYPLRIDFKYMINGFPADTPLASFTYLTPDTSVQSLSAFLNVVSPECRIGDNIIVIWPVAFSEGTHYANYGTDQFFVWDSTEINDTTTTAIKSIAYEVEDVYILADEGGYYRIVTPDNNPVTYGKIKIYDFNGRNVCSEEIKSNTLKIESLANGIYLYQLLLPDKTYQGKLCVQ